MAQPNRRCVATIVLSACLFSHSSAGQDPAALNWATGDPHIHAHGCDGGVSNEQLAKMLDVNELNVGSILVWGDGYKLDRSSFTGEDHPLSVPEHILHYDMEVSAFAAGHMGHLNLLGLSDINFSEDPFKGPGTGLPIVEWALSQGERVLVGMSHAQAWPATEDVFPSPGKDGAYTNPGSSDVFGSCCQLLEFPVHVANGTATFLEEEGGYLDEQAGDFSPKSALSPGGMHLWRVLQNSGFRVPITGASDFLCQTTDLSSPNVMRTYLLIDGELTYETYLDAIRAGRTVAAVGASDWIDFTVDNARLGDEIRTSTGRPLQVAVATNLSRAGDVRIVVNGEPVDSFTVEAGPQTQTRTLDLDKSSWITVQSSHVQTSPIYALVDGQPIRASADDACYLVQYMDHLSEFVSNNTLKGIDPSEVMPAYQHARDVFQQRFLEAGGTSCSSLVSSEPSSIYSLRDNDLDGHGDRAVNLLSAMFREVGEAKNNETRLVAKFPLPVTSKELKSARLRFFLDGIKGTPVGPISLFHSNDDNDLERKIADYEDTTYVDTRLNLVVPTDEIRKYYELDVTDLVVADYENDIDDPISAFRLQIAEAGLLQGEQLYRFLMPGSNANYPELLLAFFIDEYDFDRDGSYTIDDLNQLLGVARSSTNNAVYDVNGDGFVDFADIQFFVGDATKLNTYMGDANLDGEFTSSDFVDVFRAGRFETDQLARWSEGDWNGDERFDSNDLVVAFQDGGYEQGPRPVVAVPEPTAIAVAANGIAMLFTGRRLRLRPIR